MNEKNENQIFGEELTGKDSFFTNELTQLGNQAVKRGLISGHGYHGGKYEILCNGQIFLLSPEEAHSYLKKLVEQHQNY
ncbi:MAG TPA: hypothetical protein V6D37_12235 [Candidatus Sericytochromatia bacterium]|jgi:hypothetical protein